MAKNKEGIIEDYLCHLVRKVGGRAEKLAFVGKRGAPDRYCFFQGGNLFAVECKAADGELHPLQQMELDKLEDEGFATFVVYSKEDAETAVVAMVNNINAKTGDKFVFDIESAILQYQARKHAE